MPQGPIRTGGPSPLPVALLRPHAPGPQGARRRPLPRQAARPRVRREGWEQGPPQRSVGDSLSLYPRDNGAEGGLDVGGGAGAHHGQRVPLQDARQELGARATVGLGRGPPAPQGGRRPHLPLPVGGVDKDDALGQPVVGDENVVQLVVHGLPGDLQTQPVHTGRGPATTPRSQPPWAALSSAGAARAKAPGPGQRGSARGGRRPAAPPSAARRPAHLQLAPRIRAALVVQAVGSLVLWPRRLPLLQGRAPAAAAGLLPLGPVGARTGWGRPRPRCPSSPGALPRAQQGAAPTGHPAAARVLHTGTCHGAAGDGANGAFPARGAGNQTRRRPQRGPIRQPVTGRGRGSGPRGPPGGPETCVPPE